MSKILYANERHGVYPNSYYLASSDQLEPFGALSGEHDCDVCVIGGGFSGLSAALHLRRAGYDVVVLDAHRVGWGASGRNGGQVGSGQRLDQMELEELVGLDDAKSLWKLGEQAKALVSSLIEENNIDCHYVSGVMDVNHKKRYSDETRAYVDHLQTEYDYDKIRYMNANEVRSVLDTDAYFDGTHDAGAGHLHPLRFVLGLARLCVSAGVRIFEKTEALDVVEGRKVTVKTSAGMLNAEHMIIATNGYGDGLLPQVRRRVLPINNFVIATEPLDERVARSLIANNAAVADTKFVVNYFRMSKDNRLLFGGRESYRYKFPADIKNYVRQAMLKIYPQLRHVKIEYGWGGVVGVTMNRMPFFGQLSRRILSVGGYSGHGVALGVLGGQLAAETIQTTAERFSVMERVPTEVIPGGGRLRLPLLALGMMYYSLRDRI